MSVDAVGQWILQHIDELLDRYPELKKKILQIILPELEERMATKEDIKDILNEIRLLREDFNRQQQQIEGLMNEIRLLREDFNKLSVRLDIKISALGARWGLLSENAFREGLRFVVERFFGGSVRRWTYYDSEGVVYGEPSEIDVDVLVKDNKHILIEIKASVDKSDIAELYRKGLLYEKVVGVKPRLVIVSPFVRSRAYKLASKLEVEIIEGVPQK